MTSDPVELLYYAGQALWMSVLIGNPPPATVALHARMNKPEPGDLVIEIGRIGGAFDPDSVGRLLRIEHSADEARIRYVIEPLGRQGEEQGWRNARFVALPDQRSSWQWADGSGNSGRREQP